MRPTDMHGTAGKTQERSDRKERLAEIKERITKKGDPTIPETEVKTEKGKGEQERDPKHGPGRGEPLTKRKQEESRDSKDIKQGGGVRLAEGKRDFRSPEGPPRRIRLLPREGITVLDEVTTQREKRRETMDFVDGYGGEHELIAGVNTVICSRCGYRDHFSKLPEECSVSRRQKDKEKRDTDEASKERGLGKSG